MGVCKKQRAVNKRGQFRRDKNFLALPENGHAETAGLKADRARLAKIQNQTENSQKSFSEGSETLEQQNELQFGKGAD